MTTEQVPNDDETTRLNPRAALLGLFDRISLRERIARIRRGLRLPEESGEHKWAVFELKRFMSPAAAVLAPLLVLLLLVGFKDWQPPDDRTTGNLIRSAAGALCLVEEGRCTVPLHWRGPLGKQEIDP